MATEKVSISLNEDVLAAARHRAGPRGLSQYVNDALRYQLQRDRLADLLEEFERSSGPVESRVMEEVRGAWPAPRGERRQGRRAGSPTRARRSS